nr:integrase, catalytic region, zinc finger, CCHC-type, peptidase aspartic, catalytic [Tanacetum cinerariifolium]
IDYIRHTQEEAATLREIVESERLLSPLNTSLAYAFQELLMNLQQTCPSITDLGTNLVAVTPKNKTKQIRRTVQITKSGKTTVATSPSPNIDSNTPVLSSTRVTLVSSASGSKSQDNTKKNRIWRTQKKAKETELEDHLRTVKSSLNKANVVNSKATSSVIKKPKAKNVPNKMEPNKSWGSSSNVSTSPTDCRLSKSSFGMIMWQDNGLWRLSDWKCDYFSGVLSGRTRAQLIFYRAGQFCDSNLEVAFRQHSCFIRNLEGVDLLIACAMGKNTKKTHKRKSKDTNQEKLYLLHMDLCGPMRVESVNGK